MSTKGAKAPGSIASRIHLLCKIRAKISLAQFACIKQVFDCPNSAMVLPPMRLSLRIFSYVRDGRYDDCDVHQKNSRVYDRHSYVDVVYVSSSIQHEIEPNCDFIHTRWLARCLLKTLTGFVKLHSQTRCGLGAAVDFGTFCKEHSIGG